MMKSSAALLLVLVGASAACKMPPPKTVHFDSANAGGSEYPPLPEAHEVADPEAKRRDPLAQSPVCDVRSGKLVVQDPRLARVNTGVTSWQQVEKKTPPKPPAPPPDPNAGPVTTDGKSVTVRIPGLAGLASGKKKTDYDADWFAVSCADGKITATLVDETMDLDVLYAIDRNSENDLQILGVSLKQKSILNVQINTIARKPKTIPHTRFLIWDVSKYVTNPIEDVIVMKADKYSDRSDDGGLHVYFLEPGKTAGIHFETAPYSERGEIGRWATTEAATTAAQPAAPAAQPAAPAAQPAAAPAAAPAAPAAAPAAK
jgi:hypothetical protein